MGKTTGVTVGVAVGVAVEVGVGVGVGVGDGVGLGVADGVGVGVGVASRVLVNTHFTTSSASSLIDAFPTATSPWLLSSSQTIEVRPKPAGKSISEEK